MAASAYTDTVQKVYIAYYGRAADPVGLAYWSKAIDDAGGSLDAIMASFGTSAEATTLYGSLSNSAKVNAIYQQSFGRDADFAGLMYYSGQLSAGTMTASSIAQNIFDGATGTDATTLTNKLAVAKAYTTAVDAADEVVAYAGTVAADAARTLLGTVDSTTTVSGFDVDTSIAAMVTAANTTPETAAEKAAAAKVITDAAAAKVITDAAAAVVAANAAAAKVIADAKVVSDAADAAADTAAAKLIADAKVLSDAAAAKAITDAADAKVISDAAAAKVITDAAAKVIADAKVVSDAAAAAGTSINLTTSSDAPTGGVGPDSFNGALVGANASGSTIQAGDIITGGAGGDSLKISATGAAGTHTLAGVQTSGVETLDIQDYTNSGVVTYDAALMDGLTTVSLSASAADGDISVTNVSAIANASMKNGSGDMTLGYSAAAVVGTADTQNLTVSNITGGAFSVDGIETIAITSDLVKNTLASVSGADLTAVNVAGSKDLTITTALANTVTTVDASDATGKVTIGVATGGDVTVTGGSGADTITIAGLTKADTIDGGAGSDTLKIAASSTQAFTDHKLTSIETVAMTFAATSTIDVKALDDTTSASLAASTTNTDVTVNNLGAAQSVTVTNDSANTLELGDIAVNLEDDTGLADSMTVNLVAKTNAAQTLDLLTIDDAAETLNLNVSGATTTAIDATLTSLIADGAKTINITGAGNFLTTLDESGATANVTTLIDASTATGELNITDAVANDMTIKGSQGENTIALGTSLSNKDTIIGGASAKDSVSATVGTATTATVGKYNLSAIETLKLTATDAQTATVDLSASTGVTTVSVIASSTTGDGVVNLKGLAAGTKVLVDEVATNDFDGTLNLTLADATGTADALTLELGRTTGTGAGSDTITATSTGIESVTINAVATAADANFDVSSVDATTFTLSGGDAGTHIDLTESSATLNKSVTTVDASALVGDLVVDASGTDSVGVAFDLGNLLITTTTGDKVTGSASTTSFDSLAGTFAADDTDAEFTQFTGIEDYTLTFKDAVNITAETDAGIGDGDAAVKTITMTGGNSLTTYSNVTNAGAIDGAKLTSFDASGLGGAVSLNVDSALMDTLTVKGSTAASTDSLVFSGVDGLTATTGAATTSGVESIDIRTVTAASVIDASGMTGVTTLAIENDQNVTIQGLAAGVAVQLGESATAGLEDYTGQLTVKLADTSGTADALTVQTVASGTNDDVNAQLVIAGVETVTLAISDDATAADVELGVSGVTAGTIVVTGGATGENLDLTDGGTTLLSGSTTTVDASAFLGTINVTAETNTGTTLKANGAGIATIIGSTTADTFTIGKTTGVTHSVAGGTGSDTLNLTLDTGTTVVSSVTAVETMNLIADAGAVGIVITAGAGFYNDTVAETVTLTGGSSSTTFDSGANGVDSGSGLTLFDATGFKGRINDLVFDADQLASTVTVKGGDSAKDVVSATFANAQLVRMSGVETLGVTMTGSVAIDVSNVTDMTALTMTSDTTARVGTISQLGAGVAISVIADDDNDGLTVVRSDASAADNAQSLTINATNAGENFLLDMANIETLNLKMGTGSGDTDLVLTNFDMDTAGKTNAIVVTGTENLDITAISVDTTSIDASGMTAGGVDLGVRSTNAITFTGSDAAADSVKMTHEDDVLTGGEKAGIIDSLVISKTAILGGLKVDLTKADQIITMNGSANAAVQTGFENVDASGFSGFGADMTGNDEANIMIGTVKADSISTGAGNDIIALDSTMFTTATVDTMDGGTGTDQFSIRGGSTISASNDFAVAIANTSNMDLTTIVAHDASSAILSFSAHADVVTDLALDTIDFRIDTTVAGSNVIDLSAVGTAASDFTIFGSAGVDTITLEAGGNETNTVVFAGTGATNSTDVIVGFETGTSGTDGEILDFDAFLGAGSALVGTTGSATAATAAATEFAAASASAIDISGKVAVYDVGAATITATNLAAEFAGGAAFAAAVTKAVIFVGDATTARAGQVWYFDNSLDGTAGTASAADLVLVGTLSTNLDIDTITGNQVA